MLKTAAVRGSLLIGGLSLQKHEHGDRGEACGNDVARIGFDMDAQRIARLASQAGVGAQSKTTARASRGADARIYPVLRWQWRLGCRGPGLPRRGVGQRFQPRQSVQRCTPVQQNWCSCASAVDGFYVTARKTADDPSTQRTTCR